MVSNIYNGIVDSDSRYNSKILAPVRAYRVFASRSNVGLGLGGTVQPLFGSASAHFGQFKTWDSKFTASDTHDFLSAVSDASTPATASQAYGGVSFEFDYGSFTEFNSGRVATIVGILVSFDGNVPVFCRQGEPVNVAFDRYTLYGVVVDSVPENFSFWSAYNSGSRGLTIHFHHDGAT